MTPIDRIRAAPPYIIAEVASAHNGDPQQLLRLVDAAAEARANAVKFQWFKYDFLAMPDYEWYGHYVRLFIDEGLWEEVVGRCVQASLDVWVDVFDEWGYRLVETYDPGITGVKIPPTIVLEPDLPFKILHLRKPTLLGVGGHDDEVIDKLISRFRAFRDNLILMHGFQGYPTREEDIAIQRVSSLRARYGAVVGYADHVDGAADDAFRIPEYAFFAGAEVIEKHICLDRSAKGYDYHSSLEPAQFKTLVGRLERCRVLWGSDHVGKAEKEYLRAATRCLVRRSIAKDEWIFPGDVIYRRTSEESALLPDEVQDMLPGVAERSMGENSPILAGDIRKLKQVAIVACRLKSTRLPNKALLPIGGIPAIERCLLNVTAIRHIDATVLATSTHPGDTPLERYTLNGKVAVIRGAEDDVVDRFLKAASEHRADIVLRITGDCPVVSYEIAELLIESHLEERADCTFCETYAVGTACEIYTVDALKRLKRLMPDASYSEYMLFYFKNNPEHFKLNRVVLPQKYQRSDLRLTLDEAADLALFNRLFQFLAVGYDPVSFDRIVEFFDRYPEAARINRGVALKWADDAPFVAFLDRVTKIPDGNRA